MTTNFFLLLNSLGALSFGVTPKLIYIKSFTFSFFLTFFSTNTTPIILDNWCTINFKKRGRGLHALIFVIFVISIFFAK
jgi:hypothetical protein